MGFWRNLYYYAGWEYKPTETTEKIKRNRHELLVQIRSYGSDIKDIVLREEGEIPQKIKATQQRELSLRQTMSVPLRTPTPTIDVGILDNCNDFLDGTECDAPKTIQEYTALFEGFDVPKKKKRRKRNPHKINF